MTEAAATRASLSVLGYSYMLPMGIYEVGLGRWLVVSGIQVPRALASAG